MNQRMPSVLWLTLTLLFLMSAVPATATTPAGPSRSSEAIPTELERVLGSRGPGDRALAAPHEPGRLIIELADPRSRDIVEAELRTGSGGEGETRAIGDRYLALDGVDLELLEQPTADGLIVAVRRDVTFVLAQSSASERAGATTLHSFGTSGSGQVVAVLDTGTQATHPMIDGSIVAEACFDSLDDSCPGNSATAFGPAAGEPCEGHTGRCGHGTHVASSAIGRASSGVGPGIAPDAGLISIRVFNDGGSGASLADIVDAMEWVRERRNDHRIAAVNLSLGTPWLYSSSCDSYFPEVHATVDRLAKAGIVTVAAAGNAGSTNGISAPACLSNVVAVGASNDKDKRASFSNASSDVDLFAPGTNILAAVPDGFAYKSGTSMATPQVAGALALLAEKKPSAATSARVAAIRESGPKLSVDGKTFRRLDLPAALSSPGRPSNVSATHGDQSGVVSWTPAGRGDGSRITSYLVTVHPGGKTTTVNGGSTSATVNGLDNHTDYTFTVRARNRLATGNTRLSNLIIPKPPPAPHGFPDVPNGSYYNHPVRWLKAEGITDGYGNTGHYKPHETVTRAQMAAFLWRAAGEPTGYPHHGFPDVSSGSYYNHAVRWLKAEGITDGYGNTGHYKPHETVTRAQMAAFLHRLAERPSAWKASDTIPSTIVF